MAKDLQWFKFSPLNWMTGRIRRESPKVQVAFIEIMCQYWKNECKMTFEQAELEIGDSIQRLTKMKLIKHDGDNIRIQFLDDQMVAIEDTGVQKSNAAKSRWEKEKSRKMQVHTDALHMHKSAMQKDADKIRQDKTRVDLYETNQKAFEDISSNFNETEPQRNVLVNRGWRSATKKDTDALLFHFLESQVDLQRQDSSDIKSHFKRWLNKVELTELQSLSKKIHERQSA